ncbi:MAG: hypothetical protein WAP35_09800 [Solirubrobacterales bacterium]
MRDRPTIVNSKLRLLLSAIRGGVYRLLAEDPISGRRLTVGARAKGRELLVETCGSRFAFVLEVTRLSDFDDAFTVHRRIVVDLERLKTVTVEQP